MACRLTELVLDCADPEGLARFWCAVLDYQELGREDDGSVEIGRPGEYPTIVLGPVDEPKRQKLRLHIDVNPTDRDQDAELERLLSLGATLVDIGQGDVSWHVLTDPEGNEFCLLRSRVAP
ncbi:catechol-2,3-dioxygenase [Saccharothrix tamanrassetensis]|uniref:Catechol-2,3-dioxygenase n=1 Tax=Saccharothrix tamanrassetensis TaxID=1051531 RepID=A0A841CC23_9PSEU|nr:VOC family protein [Saccharothrix tamanrassetensis]MBB5956072.1 catechol-2,3-dioxygenase [Saccharothrix tamanrassetensis]